MSYSAAFHCIDGCPGSYPVDEVIYRCPSCDGLLEVRHHVDAWRERTPEQWRATFDERYMRTRFPYGSGVWGKKEWVQPHVQDENVVSLLEGGTNLMWATRYGRQLGMERLWVKHCGTSHTGSFKDLGMTVLVSTVAQMIADGAHVRAIACASTGDTSAALAAYGAAAGIPVVVLLPADKISAAQLVQPMANGALVASLDTDFDGCMRVVQRLTEDPTVYLANSMNSLRVEGQKTIAVEIVQQLDWEIPDWVLVPGGNLGNVSAIAKGFQDMVDAGLISQMPRLVCCQAAKANPLFRAFEAALRRDGVVTMADYAPMVAETTLASAIQIGAPVSFPKAVKALARTDGLVTEATESELAEAVARADRTGLFCCPHTGVALAGLEKLRASGVIPADAKVVVVSTAHGLKFTEFKSRYHAGSLPDPSEAPNVPIPLGAEPEAVVRGLHEVLDRRREP
jgi:threonine synthase